MHSVPRNASASEEDRLVFENALGELLYIDTKRSIRASVERALVKGGCRILRRDVHVPMKGFVSASSFGIEGNIIEPVEYVN